MLGRFTDPWRCPRHSTGSFFRRFHVLPGSGCHPADSSTRSRPRPGMPGIFHRTGSRCQGATERGFVPSCSRRQAIRLFGYGRAADRGQAILRVGSPASLSLFRVHVTKRRRQAEADILVRRMNGKADARSRFRGLQLSGISGIEALSRPRMLQPSESRPGRSPATGLNAFRAPDFENRQAGKVQPCLATYSARITRTRFDVVRCCALAMASSFFRSFASVRTESSLPEIAFAVAIFPLTLFRVYDTVTYHADRGCSTCGTGAIEHLSRIVST